MVNFNDVTAVNTPLPYYLAELLHITGEYPEIILVHRKNEKHKQPLVPCDVTNLSINSTLNLTGCPLEVDLNVVASSVDTSPLNANFNFRDAEYLPINLKTARKFIQIYKADREEPPKTIYGLCDGTDDENTAIIGSYQSGGDIVRTLVFMKGCVSETYPQNNINSMMQKHTANTGLDFPKITTKVYCTYELYGCQFQNTDVLDNLENNGSILMKASWNTCDYTVPNCGASIDMLLQVISGHERSDMCIVFEELEFIKNCLDILASGNLDDPIALGVSVDVVDLKQSISEAILKIEIGKPKFFENLKDIKSHFHGSNILDKMWSVIKCCYNASDVKFCLDFLFEMVGSTVIKVFNDEKNTVLGKIINDISAGRMVVPYLSHKQSLELVIDLGLKRLVKKCVDVIKLYDLVIGDELLKRFISTDSLAFGSRRSTLAELDARAGLTQLQHLHMVYILLEFLQLVEQNYHFSKDVSISVVRHAYDEYILKHTPSINDILQKNQLFNLAVPLTYSDIKSVENSSFVKWQITMSTNMKNATVITSYHFSKNFLLPEVLNINRNNDGDRTKDDVNPKYFVTEVQIYKDKIF